MGNPIKRERCLGNGREIQSFWSERIGYGEPVPFEPKRRAAEFTNLIRNSVPWFLLQTVNINLSLRIRSGCQIMPSRDVHLSVSHDRRRKLDSIAWNVG
jgi:hypothetical protein